MKYIKAGIAVLLLVLLDQWTKVLAVGHLMNTDGITLIPKVFRLYYLENRGSAFGLMQNQKVFLVIFTDLKININLEKYAIIFILAHERAFLKSEDLICCIAIREGGMV